MTVIFANDKKNKEKSPEQKFNDFETWVLEARIKEKSEVKQKKFDRQLERPRFFESAKELHNSKEFNETVAEDFRANIERKLLNNWMDIKVFERLLKTFDTNDNSFDEIVETCKDETQLRLARFYYCFWCDRKDISDRLKEVWYDFSEYKEQLAQRKLEACKETKHSSQEQSNENIAALPENQVSALDNFQSTEFSTPTFVPIKSTESTPFIKWWLDKSVLWFNQKDLKKKSNKKRYREFEIVPRIESLSEVKKQKDLEHTLVEWWVLLEKLNVEPKQMIIDLDVMNNFIFKKDRFALEKSKSFKNLDNLDKYIKTPEWKKSLEDSMKFYSQYFLTRSLWLDSNSPNLKEKFEQCKNYSEKINEWHKRLQSISDKYEPKIRDAIEKSNNSKERGRDKYVENVKESLTKELSKEFKEIAKLYLRALIHINPESDNIKSNDNIRFPVWLNEMDINLWPLNSEIKRLKQTGNWNLDINKLEKFIDKNIDKLLTETFLQRRISNVDLMIQNVKNNPWKTVVNVAAVVLWAWAVWADLFQSKWSSMIRDWLVYTAVHDVVRSYGYGAIYKMKWWNFIEWMNEWVWFSEKLWIMKCLTQKTNEVIWNIALFWIFWKTWKILEKLNLPGQTVSIKEMEKMIRLNLSAAAKQEYLGWMLLEWSKFAWTFGTKVWMEGGFFTVFQEAAAWLTESSFEALHDWGNTKEIKNIMLKKLDNLTNPERLLDNLIYNMVFISTVRGSAEAWARINYKLTWPSKNEARRMDQIHKAFSKFDSEVHYLQEEWIRFEFDTNKEWKISTKVLDKDWNELSPSDWRLERLNKVLSRINRIQQWIDSKPEENIKVTQDAHKNKPHNSHKKKILSEEHKENQNHQENKKPDESSNWNMWTNAWPDRLWDIWLHDFVRWLDWKERMDYKWIILSPNFYKLATDSIQTPTDSLWLNSQIDKSIAEEFKNIRDKIQDVKDLGKDKIKLVIKWVEKDVDIYELEKVLEKVEKKIPKEFKESLDKAMRNSEWSPDFMVLFAEKVNVKIYRERWIEFEEIETWEKNDKI